MRQKGFTPLLIILSIVILGIVGYFSYKKYLPQPVNITQSVKGIGYKFSWDETTKNVIVSKNDTQVMSFKFVEEPLDVYFYAPQNILVLATGNKDIVGHLYIYKDNMLTKVFSGQIEEIGSEKIATRLVRVIFSPDGSYLTFKESGWEWTEGHIFSLNSLSEIKVKANEDKPYVFRTSVWDPNSLCFVSVSGIGMWGAAFDIFQIKNGLFDITEVEPKDKLTLNTDTSKARFWWNNDCSGVVSFENDNSTPTYYKFSGQSNLLSPANQIDTKNLKTNPENYEEQIYSKTN